MSHTRNPIDFYSFGEGIEARRGDSLPEEQ